MSIKIKTHPGILGQEGSLLWHENAHSFLGNRPKCNWWILTTSCKLLLKAHSAKSYCHFSFAKVCITSNAVRPKNTCQPLHVSECKCCANTRHRLQQQTHTVLHISNSCVKIFRFCKLLEVTIINRIYSWIEKSVSSKLHSCWEKRNDCNWGL